jgi:hypothetical protein
MLAPDRILSNRSKDEARAEPGIAVDSWWPADRAAQAASASNSRWTTTGSA